ncbi:unnamed protein product, partial [Gulo gulo]
HCVTGPQLGWLQELDGQRVQGHILHGRTQVQQQQQPRHSDRQPSRAGVRGWQGGQQPAHQAQSSRAEHQPGPQGAPRVHQGGPHEFQQPGQWHPQDSRGPEE